MRTFVVGVLTLILCAPLALGQNPPKDTSKADNALAPAAAKGASAEKLFHAGDSVATLQDAKLTYGEQVVASVPKGTQLQVKDVNGRWAFVVGKIAGKTQDGWLDNRVLSLVSDPPESAPAPPSIPAPPVTSPAAAPAAPTAADNREADLARRVASLEEQVAQLRERNKELVEIANNQSNMLRDIAASRTSPEGSKYFVPSVQAISADPASRQALVDTVAKGMSRSTGNLVIRNDMNSTQSLLINGVRTVDVLPHSHSVVPVPSGTATTELVGAGEGTRSWAISAPNYTQEVIVAPAVNSVVSVVGQWRYDPLTGGYWRTLP